MGGLITKLYDEDYTVVSLSANLVWVYNAFYSKLYIGLDLDEQRQACSAELLNHASCKFQLQSKRC